MRSGSRRHLITIEQRADTVDEYGGKVASWTEFTKAWAAIKMSRGRELVAAQAAQSEMVGTFNIRWIEGVTADMRISYNGKYYNIAAVVDVNEQRRELDIMVSTGLSEG